MTFKHKPAAPFYCFFFFFCFSCALLSTITSTATCIRCPFSGKPDFYFQDFVKRRDEENMGFSSSTRRGILSGPGSSPPRCTSKCDKCTPCKPVHVPVPPGTPVTTEYYPEAWRCKCGNKLYMP
ncbi:hypothetical protein P3X46_022122 [Hevea brasiliensis]|uniref:Epidermal patterning factor-like protein n=1 Tax=Hevea brasiliensis TaxID=3981 RepID=A0ABQ9LHP3_HEVBR|nr:EPIDERMAL PATTERNING FACTOR-like protein 6 isoform X2 [Hevea brasiliensis]KAJ9167471.1 hypothetical protein P3X46_022122 [Hevea brasiliensis]